MKAQIGLEYMAVLTLMIALMIPLFYLANQKLDTSRTSSEATAAMNAIVSSADSVYAQSPGSKISTNVYIPNGYDNASSYMTGKTIVMRYNLANGMPYDAMGFTKGNISGRLPPYSGYHIMTFTMNQSGWVLINTSAT